MWVKGMVIRASGALSETVGMSLASLPPSPSPSPPSFSLPLPPDPPPHPLSSLSRSLSPLPFPSPSSPSPLPLSLAFFPSPSSVAAKIKFRLPTSKSNHTIQSRSEFDRIPTSKTVGVSPPPLGLVWILCHPPPPTDYTSLVAPNTLY